MMSNGKYIAGNGRPWRAIVGVKGRRCENGLWNFVCCVWPRELIHSWRLRKCSLAH